METSPQWKGHATPLAKKVEEVHDIKVSLLELRFEAGEKEDEIQLWSTKLDEDVGVFETTIVDLGLSNLRALRLKPQRKKKKITQLRSEYENMNGKCTLKEKN